MHRHKNADHLDKFGNAAKTPAYDLHTSSEQADTRSWNIYDGVLAGTGEVIDVEGKVGITFELVVRISPEGKSFARAFTLDAAGGIIKVSREKVVSNVSRGLFVGTSTGVSPKGTALVGEVDAFFTRQNAGFETRDDFTIESETDFMDTPDAEDIRLKGDDDGEDPGPDPTLEDWADVDLATHELLTAIPSAEGVPLVTKLTGNSGQVAALALDGVTVSTGNRILVKDAYDPKYNGIYKVEEPGGGGVSFVLVRDEDADEASEFANDRKVKVVGGTENAGKTFKLQVTGDIILNETILPFVEVVESGG